MASYTTSEIRVGPAKSCSTAIRTRSIENEMVKPGKGQAFNRIKVRNLKTGRTIERTFKSGEAWRRPTWSTRTCSTCTRTATSGIS